jgi:hypothetical protein
MRHARALLLSRPFFTRIPDPSLLASESGSGVHHVAATRDEAGTYALIYVPDGKRVEVRTEALKGGSLLAYWFDPRTGTAQRIGVHPRAETLAFEPPYGGMDWVLTLEDADAGYPPPGSAPLPQKEAP